MSPRHVCVHAVEKHPENHELYDMCVRVCLLLRMHKSERELAHFLTLAGIQGTVQPLVSFLQNVLGLGKVCLQW